MTKKRILVTGASGCIGHYISEALIQNTNHELYLLVRNPNKLQVDTTVRPGITILQGDMQEIGKFSNLLKTIDIAVLTATSWGGEGIFDINVFKTLELMNLLNPEKCEQVIYFSTASVLNYDNQPLKQAGEIGTDYIRSKYDCLHQIEKLAIFPKITTVFPTLVLGGDDQKPYSHLTSGIPKVTNYINIIRFLQADASFHFIHGRDIATIIQYLIDYPPQPGDPRRFVLGQSSLTVNQAIEQVCAYFNKKIYFRIPLSLGLANLIIVLFRIQMAAWDRFCMNYRHFNYANAINPNSFNLPNYCATMTDVLKISQVKNGI
ncbi:NAD(P)-dependent oxidoreductase [Dolichospermum circinale CS-1225]|uniref:NAD(P)-dependent oxidoreductase n=1 Tax=Dolichospermum circinale CS-537/01 TaxID=3021739 RepID=A0ABT5A360_9CYAN|nr:NAD(P)-dependent oxidoreductase [Dolichospermum circinale]MDB9460753.1 NAD(P)-dependent oxidoreductase [Dolichospermum circinale CS-545/17]MDB9465873.1 NAD(P)-dependent oxidoreductase [Dolichospermum circinale CS-539/09]MDB9470637.1 NAD(P)-dependent oxidoreductase [Dolichospermum circinale CS-539]MDB9486369.1 NAD(P)-dependent oxidoreductase [Dolichospermum circinale CS-537/01]MDB9524310.1 NAD(P)-dependent oxidoreductase [Dolichospermum circinale CS-1225]